MQGSEVLELELGKTYKHVEAVGKKLKKIRLNLHHQDGPCKPQADADTCRHNEVSKLQAQPKLYGR